MAQGAWRKIHMMKVKGKRKRLKRNLHKIQRVLLQPIWHTLNVCVCDPADTRNNKPIQSNNKWSKMSVDGSVGEKEGDVVKGNVFSMEGEPMFCSVSIIPLALVGRNSREVDTVFLSKTWVCDVGLLFPPGHSPPAGLMGDTTDSQLKVNSQESRFFKKNLFLKSLFFFPFSFHPLNSPSTVCILLFIYMSRCQRLALQL